MPSGQDQIHKIMFSLKKTTHKHLLINNPSSKMRLNPMYRTWRRTVIKLLSFLKLCARFYWSLIILMVHWGSISDRVWWQHRWGANILTQCDTNSLTFFKKDQKEILSKKIYLLKPASKVKLCSSPQLAFWHSNMSLLHYLCSYIFPQISFKLHLHANRKYTWSFLIFFKSKDKWGKWETYPVQKLCITSIKSRYHTFRMYVLLSAIAVWPDMLSFIMP